MLTRGHGAEPELPPDASTPRLGPGRPASQAPRPRSALVPHAEGRGGQSLTRPWSTERHVLREDGNSARLQPARYELGGEEPG